MAMGYYRSDPRPVTFTGAIGAAFNFPLRLIIRACVRLRIHPNVLTFTGVVINIAAGWALSQGHFLNAFWIMIVANIFDFIDGKVAIETGLDQQVRRLLGLGHRPLLRPRAVGRPDLPVRVARAHRLRAHHVHLDGLRDDDELHARAPSRSSRSARSASWSGPSASCSS